jgi:hypothetical protein
MLAAVRRAAPLALAAVAVLGLAAPARAADPPSVLYINFSDGSEAVTRGQVDDATRNQSSMGAVPHYPPFSWPGIADGSVSRRELVSAITRQVNQVFLPYNLLVTTTRPADAPYTMVLVGGSPTLFGYDSNLAGVAFMDCEDQQPANVVFAFPTALRGNVHGLFVTIAQEAAHSFGLEHSMDPTDIMYPKVDPAQREFPDREGSISGDRLCGRETQNPHRRLLQTLGPWPGGAKPFDDGARPDTDPPVVLIREPAAGGPVPQPFTLRATVQDDSTIDQVTVEAGGESFTVTRGPYAWSLDGFPPGPLTLRVAAVDAAGNRADATLAITVAAGPPGGCAVTHGGKAGLPGPLFALAALCRRRHRPRRTCPGGRGRL